MSYLRNNKIWEEEENLKWDLIEISKVDDKIIRELIYKLELDNPYLSDSFFIALESLLKLRKKVEFELDLYINETDQIHYSKVDLFNFLLEFIKNDTIEDILVPQLYHPDFVIRAKTIFKLDQAGDVKYLKYILPLTNDPDDSVRWAVVKFLEKHDMIKNPLVYKELKSLIERESNQVIKKKIKEIFKTM